MDKFFISNQPKKDCERLEAVASNLDLLLKESELFTNPLIRQIMSPIAGWCKSIKKKIEAEKDNPAWSK